MDPPTDWVINGGKMALDFDGVNDYVKVQPSSTFATTGGTNWTLSAWVYPTNMSLAVQTIFNRQKFGTSPRDYIFYAGNNKFQLQNSNGTSYPTISTSAIYQNNIWYHVVGSCDVNGNANIYVNGVSQASGTLRTDVAEDNSRNVIIGTTFDGVGEQYRWLGALDDLRIYNRQITTSEIQLLYTGGRGVGLMPERRRWFYFPSAFTGTASLTTGAAIASGSATFTPKFTATSAVTTKGATCSGSATFTKPVYTATSTVTIAAATCSLSGTFVKPVYSATSSVTIAAATCSATGTFTNPVYTATSVLTVGHATASGAATFAVPVYTASASVAVGATVVNVAGSVVVPTYTAAAAVSVGAAVASGTASNNFVAGPYRVAARQVFVPGAVAFQVRTTGASAAQVF